MHALFINVHTNTKLRGLFSCCVAYMYSHINMWGHWWHLNQNTAQQCLVWSPHSYPALTLGGEWHFIYIIIASDCGTRRSYRPHLVSRFFFSSFRTSSVKLTWNNCKRSYWAIFQFAVCQKQYRCFFSFFFWLWHDDLYTVYYNWSAHIVLSWLQGSIWTHHCVFNFLLTNLLLQSQVPLDGEEARTQHFNNHTRPFSSFNSQLFFYFFFSLNRAQVKT